LSLYVGTPPETLGGRPKALIYVVLFICSLTFIFGLTYPLCDSIVLLLSINAFLYIFMSEKVKLCSIRAFSSSNPRLLGVPRVSLRSDAPPFLLVELFPLVLISPYLVGVVVSLPAISPKLELYGTVLPINSYLAIISI